MSIECVYLAALDKRKHMVPTLREQVKKYLNLPLEVFWSGNGEDPDIKYNRIDWPASPELFKHCSYGAGEGRRNHANAFLSHRVMFDHILNDGYNNALILEEDIYFVDDRWNKIYKSEYIQEFINAESCWDAIYFGYQMMEYPGDTDDLESAESAWRDEGTYNISRVQPSYVNISGLHAILLNRRLLERLSNIEVGPMDSYLGQNMNRFKLFYCRPKLIGALASFSCAEGRFQSRSTLI